MKQNRSCFQVPMFLNSGSFDPVSVSSIVILDLFFKKNRTGKRVACCIKEERVKSRGNKIGKNWKKTLQKEPALELCK